MINYKKNNLYLLILIVSMAIGLAGCSLASNDEDYRDESEYSDSDYDDNYYDDNSDDDKKTDEANKDSNKDSDDELNIENEGYDAMLVGHRGFSLIAPENTIASYEYAAEYGADMIELDVQMTKDNCIVIFHDNNMYRIIGKDSFVGDYSYDEIKEMSAGQWFNDFYTEETASANQTYEEHQEDILKDYHDEAFPSFRETLEFAKENGIGIDIEIKTLNPELFNDWECKWFVSQVVKQVNEYDMADKVIFSSFNYDYLQQIEAMNSEYYTMFIADMNDTDLLVNSCNTDGVALTYNNVQGGAMDRLHESGKEVYVWVIDDETQMRELLDMGADGIITNDVELGHKIIK